MVKSSPARTYGNIVFKGLYFIYEITIYTLTFFTVTLLIIESQIAAENSLQFEKNIL